MCGLRMAEASLGAEHTLQGQTAAVAVVCGLGVVAPGTQSTDSVAVAHGLRCSVACGIFPGQGSNPRLLRRQADSSPLSPQESC